MLAFLVATVASASDLSTSLWHPGAEPMDRGFGYAGTGVLAAVTDDAAGTWLAATGGWAPSKRLALTGTALGAVGSGLVSAGARFNAIDSPWFHAAPVVYGAYFSHEEDVRSETLGAGAGVAVEAGWRRVRFDTFVPVLKTSEGEGPVDPSKRLPGFEHFEMGMTVRMGGGHHNRLRFVVTPESGRFGYQHVGEHWFLETMVSAGESKVAGWLRSGIAF